MIQPKIGSWVSFKLGHDEILPVQGTITHYNYSLSGMGGPISFCLAEFPLLNFPMDKLERQDTTIIEPEEKEEENESKD